MALKYPDIDPILVSIGPLEIRWYSLAYIFGILIGAFYINFLAKKIKFKLPPKFIEDLIVAAVLGVVIGGRLGYIVVYSLDYYIKNPLEILQLQQMGMSFHGGLIGYFIGIIILCRRYKIDYWKICDLSACVAPIGLFLGRIANFINGELFGRITDVSWAMKFPMGGPFLRHPSQIYEALTEGLLLFIIINILFFKCEFYKKTKLLTGIFVMLYATFRIFSECFRDPDIQIGYILGYFTMGQVLSSMIFLVGLYLVALAQRVKLVK
jgi:phosphatidylglycerol---prolipoprotein diacylglyceryl transferase